MDPFWAKYDAKNDCFHPLLYHLLDVASVAEKLLERLQAKKLIESVQACGFADSDAARNFLLFWIALHDLGKATPGFQAKVSKLTTALKKIGCTFPHPIEIAENNHTKTGQQLLSEFLIEKIDDDEVATGWARIVSAHHGVLPERYGDEYIVGNGKWEELRTELIAEIEKVFSIECYPDSLPDAASQIQMMGLCTLADWIGSSEEYFPYEREEINPLSYYQRSLLRADKALETLHLSTIPKNQKDFFDLFPHFDSLNPVQDQALNIARKLPDPFMMIVEAPMGLGKTEAALGVFAEVCQRKESRGLYFALPTQATGNMVFKRLEDFLRYFNVTQGELHLLHGTASLNPLYRKLKFNAIYTEEGALYAGHWFGSGKRALLAHYGAGTIDQILLGALRSRHFFLRLFSLAGKTVIIDEVHAYDAYMSRVLEVLISWLHFLGTAVVLLSATLPAQKRSALFEAYGAKEISPQKIASYPAVHALSSEGRFVSETITDLDPESAWMTPLIDDGEWESVISMLQNRLQNGGCAAVIVNTVAQAQTLFRKLLDYFDSEELDLFHARFPLHQRLEIEKRIVERYGKNGHRPKRGIVVATQVIEQSLDLDFDLMISELAPIDLLLQRMGRLHRHKRRRPTNLQRKELHVLLPPKLSEDERIFGKSRFVYFPILLYRSAKLFSNDNGAYRELEIAVPQGLSSLIEAVYTEENEEDIASWSEKMLGEEYADTFLADQYTIPENLDNDGEELLDALENRLGDDPDDPSAKTRLGAPTVTLAIVAPEERAVESFEDVARIYGQTLRVQTRWLVEELLKRTIPDPWKQEAMLRHTIPFDPNERLEKDGRVARYDERLGLIITSTKEEQ